jgi:hypothetical protein
MITYIVRLTIDSLFHEDYLHWLKAEHVPEVLREPGFTEAELLLEKREPEAEKTHISVLYRLKTRAHLDEYLTKRAPLLRQKGIDRWGNHFSAQREVWEANEKILQRYLHAGVNLSYIGFLKEKPMAYLIDVKKLINDLRGPKGVAALTEEVARVSGEIQKLRAELQPQAETRIKEARATLDKVQRRLKEASVDLDRELNKTIVLVKKYGKEIKVAVTKKKAAPRKATRKTSKKKTAPKA